MTGLVEKERAVRAARGGVLRRLLRDAAAWAAIAAVLATLYAASVAIGALHTASYGGTLSGMNVDMATIVYRDDRGIPHIRARDDHDAFFAEGYVQGSDRLFQMDLYRRFIYGELSELLGPIELNSDEQMRAPDVRSIVAREWRRLPVRDKSALEAFSSGVNAAMRTQPLPIEFRLLLYRPLPWKAQDSLAVTLAISALIGDTADNVIRRDAFWRSLTQAQYAFELPLSDPFYDVSADGTAPRVLRQHGTVAWSGTRKIPISELGSNAWASGGAHSASGRALVANDPHLPAGIPGIWYALEMRAPHMHAAGVTIAGIPGIVLGHNERIAWGATNAMAATLGVFTPGALNRRNWKTETFHVRFGADVRARYYRSSREYGIPAATPEGMALVRWPPYYDTRSAVSTILALDTASDVRGALEILSRYAGPPQNFIIAGPHGQVAYHVAGPIPDDPAWGRYVHRARDLGKEFSVVPYDRLPSIAPSRSAIIVSANNKTYEDGYPYRLSPMFAPPYRAYRIAALLRARTSYDVRYFARMQLDTRSPADAEFAHRLAAYARTHRGMLPPGVAQRLAGWDGTFAPASKAATLEHALREDAEDASITPYAVLDALRARTPPAQFIDAMSDPLMNDSPVPWSRAGTLDVLHPFGSIGFPFLDGKALPGAGDEYTIRVQTAGLAQSMRAVWEVGAWDRGGLSLPSGESGEVGSRHYDDLRDSWVRGELRPLPFSDAAVKRAARERLLLEK